jgi:hypothetical protein
LERGVNTPVLELIVPTDVFEELQVPPETIFEYVTFDEEVIDAAPVTGGYGDTQLSVVEFLLKPYMVAVIPFVTEEITLETAVLLALATPSLNSKSNTNPAWLLV